MGMGKLGCRLRKSLGIEWSSFESLTFAMLHSTVKQPQISSVEIYSRYRLNFVIKCLGIACDLYSIGVKGLGGVSAVYFV